MVRTYINEPIFTSAGAPAAWMVGPQTQIPDEKIWYSGSHGKSFDIVREHQIIHTKSGYAEITRVVLISYGEGNKHTINKYGSREINHNTLSGLKSSPLITSYFRISDTFLIEIYLAVNNHLKCDCYVEWIDKQKLNSNIGTSVPR
jgi:hypothetical protein